MKKTKVNSNSIMSKSRRQEIGIELWRRNKGIGTFQWCTGMGKTYTGAIVHEKLKLARPDAKTYVIVPRKVLYDAWVEKIKDNNLKNIEVFTVQYITRNQSKLECDLLIIDEIHLFDSNMEDADIFQFVNCFNLIKYKYILGLTATIKEGDFWSIFKELCPIVDTITMDEAVENTWVAKYQEFNLLVRLDEESKVEYEELSNYISSTMSRLGGLDKIFLIINGKLENVPVNKLSIINGAVNLKSPPVGNSGGRIIKTLKGEYIRKRRNGTYYIKVNYAKQIADTLNIEEAAVKTAAKKCIEDIHKRKKILTNNKPKLNVVKKLTDLNLKTIIFGQSIDFMEDMFRLLLEHRNDVVIYHSKLSAKEKKLALERIKNNDATIILSPQSLDEAFDCADLQIGINLAYTSSIVKYIQRKGRVARLFGDKKAYFVNICTKHTQEQKWLNEMQSKNTNIVHDYNDAQQVVDMIELEVKQGINLFT